MEGQEGGGFTPDSAKWLWLLVITLPAVKEASSLQSCAVLSHFHCV